LQPGGNRERALQRFLDALAVARCGQALAAFDPPRHARAIRGSQVEPRLGSLRLALRPQLAGGNRRFHARQKRGIA
jgi:hypothetical protein